MKAVQRAEGPELTAKATMKVAETLRSMYGTQDAGNLWQNDETALLKSGALSIDLIQRFFSVGGWRRCCWSMGKTLWFWEMLRPATIAWSAENQVHWRVDSSAGGDLGDKDTSRPLLEFTGPSQSERAVNDQGKNVRPIGSLHDERGFSGMNGWTKGAAVGLEFLDGKVGETPKSNCCTDEDGMLEKLVPRLSRIFSEGRWRQGS